MVDGFEVLAGVGAGVGAATSFFLVSLPFELLLLPGLLPLLGTGCRTEQSAYLEKALSQLERIERVAYRRSSESYLPGDTIPRRYLRYYVEQRNRADTTLRHSYLSYYNADDTTRIDGGYDGTIAVDLDHDRREVGIDDFSIPRAPYRLTDMTFFCRAEAICWAACTASTLFWVNWLRFIH